MSLHAGYAAALIHPEGCEIVGCKVAAVVAAKEAFDIRYRLLHYRLLHADGSERWMHERGPGRL
jgi:hypothetical protein